MSTKTARPKTDLHHMGELEHAYGERVHILDNLFILTALARLGGKEVGMSSVLDLLRTVYRTMIVHAVGQEIPGVDAAVPTRMVDQHPKTGIYRGRVLDPNVQVVVVDVIRAGMLPSQICFELLSSILPDDRLRLDHLNMARVAGSDGRVEKVDLSGSKVGGPVDGALLILPDPMGATGATTIRAVKHYLEHHGQPARILTLPMISTPEYMRCVLDAFENLVVYTARLDRGLSSEKVLATPPGTHWDKERGLDERDYIVPGAGGLGEVLNNSWC